MGISVLVVDDDRANRMVMERLLLHRGYSVATAYDGQNALEVIAAHQPHLMLLDIQMPRLDGYEVCRRIKSDPTTRAIRVVMMSALSSEEDRKRALHAGAEAFFQKPVEFSELLHLLDTLDHAGGPTVLWARSDDQRSGDASSAARESWIASGRPGRRRDDARAAARPAEDCER